MEHLATEGDIGCLGGILLCELQFELKESALPWGALRTFNHGIPLEQIVLLGRRVNPGIGLLLYFLEVLEESPRCRAAGVVHANTILILIYK